MSVNTSFNGDPEFVTDNATPVDAFTIPILEGNTCKVELSVFARGITDGSSAMWGITGAVKHVSGVVSGIPAGIVNLFTARKDVNATAWDATFVIVGTSIVVRITGAATQRVGWMIDGSVVGFTNGNYGGIA
jgi:hypothetical protein